MKHSSYLFISLSFFFFTACDSTSKEKTDTVVPTDDGPNVIVIFTDNMGYADLGVQKQVLDIKTPNIDSIAQNGVRMTQGYITAPQCTPSRAAMVTGQYQQRFGVDDNRYTPMSLDVTTLGERFQSLGYHTGMVGKWHLEIDQNSKEWFQKNYPQSDVSEFKTNNIPLEIRKQYFPNNRGYTDTYFGYRKNYWTTYNLDNLTSYKTESFVTNSAYRIDVVSDAAVTFIKNNHTKPFYLHVAHYAPHVPLEATQKYLNRFPNVDSVRRKYALAMISAVDDGVGRILKTLKEHQILDNTMIFLISDNGAPLGLDMTDAPIDNNKEAWDGSKNTPWVGEKGMLSDGGIHVPFVMQWSKKIPAGLVIDKPVSSLDAAYTAIKSAGASADTLNQLDGVDLLPAIQNNSDYLNNRALFWRFWRQSAVRLGKWKYIKAGQMEYLFNIQSANHEHENLLNTYPEKAKELKKLLENWETSLLRKSEKGILKGQEEAWYNFFF